MRNEVFISYAHDDQDWLAKLQTVLKPLIRNKKITFWDDTHLEAGQKWDEEIHAALERARVAILLVSPGFLASNYVNDEELPSFLKAAAGQGLKIFWVPVRSCLYEETDLKQYQAVLNPAQPLADMTPAEVDRALVTIGKAIKKVMEADAAPVEKPAPAPAPPPPPAPAPAPNQPVWSDPPAPDPIPEPVAPPATLREILPGEWQVEIQGPFPGAIGHMRLQLLPTGQFHAELTSPIGQCVMDGQWEANVFTRQIGLQGRQTIGFQVIPYITMVQVSYCDPQQIVGVTSGGEQVVWRKLGAPVPPARPASPRTPPRL